jgi:hypothetical protein
MNTSSVVKAADIGTSAVHAQAGQVPASMLAKMGLSDMSTLSDAQGMHIRGMGTTITIVEIAVVVQGHATNHTPVIVQSVNIGTSSGHRH